MRMSRLLLRTRREAPADAEAASHKLLVRGGFIRRVAAGVYTFLPLGTRVLRNVEAIVREEMDAIGAQEVLMPVMQPLELWQQSKRVALWSDVLMHVKGKGGEFVLGPTHEEVATATVAADVDSYRDLPHTIYQVQTKFRDEARPRFGLLRTRELVMKDAYSFDGSAEGMMKSYRAIYDAYIRVFERVGLHCVPVEAHAGGMGGSVNQEFMVPSAIGEDHFARCSRCDYAANVEAAEVGPMAMTEALPPAEDLAEHHTPGRPGIDLVVEYFADRRLTAAGMLKCIAMLDDEDTPVVVLVPGDRDARVPAGWRPFDDGDFVDNPRLVKGYIGPMALQAGGVRVVADWSVQTPRTWVTGANRADYHVTGATLGRDFTVSEWGSFVVARGGDRCPRCDGSLELVRALEAAHAFQLGLRYSQLFPDARFRDEDGSSQPYWMGCYGVGVSRLVAAIAEAHHDDAGLVWPAGMTPYDVHLIALGADRSPEVAAAADSLYARLAADGTTVLYDDRDLTPGVKFADADLIGCPTQLIVGARGLASGVAERKDRATGARDTVPL